ncbi:hypothetical protein LJC38_00175 [Parabacteroides sp. OttesenSCG-928-K15]|nr:hypothetical protein [Parabacteroides sp. OttesenSCG-928-K15]
MDTHRNITIIVPTMLFDFLNDQIKSYGFTNRSEVFVSLMEGLWNTQNGLQNSNTVNNILSFVTRERYKVLQHAPRTTFGVLFRGESIEKLEEIKDFDNSSNLLKAIMEAFLACNVSDKKALRKEIQKKHQELDLSKQRYHTFVSNEQYAQLQKMATRINMNISSLVHLTINLILENEELSTEDKNLPHEVTESLNMHLSLEGSTLGVFRRGVQVCVYEKDIKIKEAIAKVILKYEIQGWNEFLRRVILFLLDSPNVSLSHTPESDDMELFTEKERDEHRVMAKRSFYYSLYA